jgi:hypothetical protein
MSEAIEVVIFKAMTRRSTRTRRKAGRRWVFVRHANDAFFYRGGLPSCEIHL